MSNLFHFERNYSNLKTCRAGTCDEPVAGSDLLCADCHEKAINGTLGEKMALKVLKCTYPEGDGCEELGTIRGLCSKHNRRWNRKGRPIDWLSKKEAKLLNSDDLYDES